MHAQLRPQSRIQVFNAINQKGYTISRAWRRVSRSKILSFLCHCSSSGWQCTQPRSSAPSSSLIGGSPKTNFEHWDKAGLCMSSGLSLLNCFNVPAEMSPIACLANLDQLQRWPSMSTNQSHYSSDYKTTL